MANAGANGDGWRARVGIVLPSVNTVMEPWAQRAVPAGVSVHFSRMFLADKLTPESFVEMDRGQGMGGIRQLTSVRPQALAYGCTASSIVQGVAYDDHLRAEIHAASGVPVTTAAHAICEALTAVEARRVSLASPYSEEVDAAEQRYFAAAGFEIAGAAHLGISDGFRLAEPDAQTLFRLGMEACDPSADALVITCLNTRSHAVITTLEEATGKPVVTSTQATLWHVLRLAGIGDPLPGLGLLMARH